MAEITRQVVEQALAELAATGDVEAAAELLSEQGCQGLRGDACYCPVAVFLSRRLRLGELGLVVVGQDTVTVFGSPNRTRPEFTIPLPRRVVQLVEFIDGGGWLSLQGHPAGEPEGE